jgi:predicted RNA-binding protein with PIN domain
VVDAMNVIGARPDGWWRDRRSAIVALFERLQAFARSRSLDVTLVVDGRPLSGLAEGSYGPIYVLYPGRSGPNAADDRIIEFLREHDQPASVEVVTSDRDLASRARNLGARVRGAASLLDELDQIPD